MLALAKEASDGTKENVEGEVKTLSEDSGSTVLASIFSSKDPTAVTVWKIYPSFSQEGDLAELAKEAVEQAHSVVHESVNNLESPTTSESGISVEILTTVSA